MTLPEVLLWNELKQGKMRVYDFDRQKPIDEFIVDFYSKDLRLALEVDGSDHSKDEQANKDKSRQLRLESLGVSFLRDTNTDVLRDMGNVLMRIEDWILN